MVERLRLTTFQRCCYLTFPYSVCYQPFVLGVFCTLYGARRTILSTICPLVLSCTGLSPALCNHLAQCYLCQFHSGWNAPVSTLLGSAAFFVTGNLHCKNTIYLSHGFTHPLLHDTLHRVYSHLTSGCTHTLFQVYSDFDSSLFTVYSMFTLFSWFYSLQVYSHLASCFTYTLLQNYSHFTPGLLTLL